MIINVGDLVVVKADHTRVIYKVTNISFCDVRLVEADDDFLARYEQMDDLEVVFNAL